jgi:hypothetical protein
MISLITLMMIMMTTQLHLESADGPESSAELVGPGRGRNRQGIHGRHGGQACGGKTTAIQDEMMMMMMMISG